MVISQDRHYGASSRRWRGKLVLIKPPTSANPLKSVAPQLFPESLELFHRTGRQAVAASEVLHGLQPFLMVQAQALEDRLDMRRDRAAFIVPDRSAGPPPVADNRAG